MSTTTKSAIQTASLHSLEKVRELSAAATPRDSLNAVDGSAVAVDARSSVRSVAQFDQLAKLAYTRAAPSKDARYVKFVEAVRALRIDLDLSTLSRAQIDRILESAGRMYLANDGIPEPVEPLPIVPEIGPYRPVADFAALDDADGRSAPPRDDAIGHAAPTPEAPAATDKPGVDTYRPVADFAPLGEVGRGVPLPGQDGPADPAPERGQAGTVGDPAVDTYRPVADFAALGENGARRRDGAGEAAPRSGMPDATPPEAAARPDARREAGGDDAVRGGTRDGPATGGPDARTAGTPPDTGGRVGEPDRAADRAPAAEPPRAGAVPAAAGREEPGFGATPPRPAGEKPERAPDRSDDSRPDAAVGATAPGGDRPARDTDAISPGREPRGRDADA